MPSGGRLIAAGLGLLGGTLAQLQQAALWSPPAYAAALVAALLLAGWTIARPREVRAAATALLLAGALGAFSLTGLRAAARLADALPAELEGRDLQVVGVIAGLPQRSPEAWRFRFEVESARLGAQAVELPPLLSLGWYATGDEAGLPALHAGQRWLLTVRLKRPHGLANPHGFDYELWLFEQGLRATGYVRGPGGRLLGAGVGHWIDRARQATRDAIERRLGRTDDADPRSREAGILAALEGPRSREAGVLAALEGPRTREAGVLAALAVGDQAAIEREDWALYRQTGITHLLSISGLHVTMFAWLAGLVLGWLWRRSARAMLCCPAPLAARWGGLAAAFAYALFAGWGVPAQRTVVMLATATLIGALGLRWAWPLVWGAAAVAVSLIDPWALLQPGFWLSFVAVGMLLASGESRATVAAVSGLVATPPRWQRVGGGALRTLGGALRTQAIATLGLAPLTLVFFQQISLVGFAANLIAIPLVTLWITPLALLGVLAQPLWTLAAGSVALLNALLGALAAPSWALWSVPAAPPWAVACGLLGAALALLPLPRRMRLLSLALLLPLLAPAVPRPAPGAYELLAVDVGQGSAVLLRTARHTLLYDAGPQYSRETDAGERVLLPLLRALGVTRLDLLMLSHRDTDHVGGAAALLRGLPIDALDSSLEPAHPLRALAAERGARVGRCEAGQRWVWDGVEFELLHPAAAELDRAAAVATAANTLSCVLRVRGRWAGVEHAALLTGDLERAQELRLVDARGAALGSELLLVPHHGSRTSSSAALLDAVAPRRAVVQAGYRNRFGHPAPDVVARYAERGIALVDTPRCGAWQFGPAGEACRSSAAPRYWQHPERLPASALHNGLEVAKPGDKEPDS